MFAAWAVATMLVAAASSALAQDAGGDDLVMRGGGVYQASCAACHGTAGLGGVGRGREAAPALRGVALAYIDQTVRTGRMPIADKSLGVVDDELDDAQRRALLAYAAAELAAEGTLPTVGTGDPARGQETYVRNCAACHGATATGGIVGGGITAPGITTTDPVAVVEAIRVGPFEMPAFGSQALDDQQVNDIVAYLDHVEGTSRSAIGLREVNDVVAALAAMGLTATVLVVLVRLGRAGRGTDGREPGTWT